MKKIFFVAMMLMIVTSCAKQTTEADAYGHFESDEYSVMSESSGRLLNWNIDEGRAVSMGDTLGMVDPMHFYLQKEQIKKQEDAVLSKLTLIKSQEEAAEVELQINKKELKRFSNMLKEKAVSQKSVDDLSDRIRIAEARMKSFSAERSSVKRELEIYQAQNLLIDDQIRRSVIVSPVSGVVLSNFVNESDMVIPGKTLAYIADLSEMTMKAYISGDQLYLAKPGQKVTVKIDGPDGSLFEYDGLITWIADEAEFTPKVIQTKKERVHLVYAVKVSVNNDGRIRIGMPGELYFPAQ